MKKSIFLIILVIQTFLCFSQEKKAYYGKIVRESFSKETTENKNSELEIYWILNCDDGLNRQLIFLDGENEYSKYKKFLNSKVMVFGEIMSMETAHHKTKELIVVKNIQEVEENEVETYKYISNEIMNKSQSVILEAAKDNIDKSKIRIIDDFGKVQNPISGEFFFRDYIAYPYYSIQKFCSSIDGEIIEISNKLESSIVIKSGDIEIEYFGYIKIDKNLKVGDKILVGNYIGTLFGGGDSGMKLKIRMKYKNSIINPSLWF